LGKEEAELITQCKRGDIKSYQLLYNRYIPAMYHTCLRIVIHTADAEDVLQEAFMEAFTNLQKINNPEAFGGWLKRIVIHKAINYVKRHQLSWVELEDADIGDMAREEDIDEQEFTDKIEAITAALTTLPDKYRTVINLHIFEQMRFEDIAILMDIPSATVRSQYLRAKQKILNIIGPQT
jgi:RNA polymerase sigma factor (sigma-70 family)